MLLGRCEGGRFRRGACAALARERGEAVGAADQRGGAQEGAVRLVRAGAAEGAGQDGQPGEGRERQGGEGGHLGQGEVRGHGNQ